MEKSIEDCIWDAFLPKLMSGGCVTGEDGRGWMMTREKK